MTDKEFTKYRSKAKDSFKTKTNLFIFHLALSLQNTFTQDEFEDFKIDCDVVKLYTTEYWQQEKDHKIKNLTIQEIEKSINVIITENDSLVKACEEKYIENFSSVFPEDDFIQLIKEDVKNGCCYCHITEDKIDELGRKLKLNKKSFRGWSLEIERFDSNLEYTKGNCAMACYWCNNAKTDEFTKDEFIPIGKAIEQIWKKRLK